MISRRAEQSDARNGDRSIRITYYYQPEGEVRRRLGGQHSIDDKPEGIRTSLGSDLEEDLAYSLTLGSEADDNGPRGTHFHCSGGFTMAADKKAVADSVLHVTDTIIKLSTALLVVPMAFLNFISEMGLKAHPDALQELHPVGNFLKLGIFVPFGLSIVVGLITHYIVIHALCEDSLMPDSKLPRRIERLTWTSGFLFVIGTFFLTYLVFQFPIEIPEPFRLGSSRLG